MCWLFCGSAPTLKKWTGALISMGGVQKNNKSMFHTKHIKHKGAWGTQTFQ